MRAAVGKGRSPRPRRARPPADDAVVEGSPDLRIAPEAEETVVEILADLLLDALVREERGADPLEAIRGALARGRGRARHALHLDGLGAGRPAPDRARHGAGHVNSHLELLLSRIYDGAALAPAHREDLRKSGVTEATRIAQGIRSVPTSDFDRLLGFPVPTVASLLLIPYPDPVGGYFDMFQVKLFPALVDAAGHSTRYLQPKGTTPRLYFVRSVLSMVIDPTKPIYLVEGAKKAIAAAQLGLAAVGFAGVHGWHVRGSRRLLDDFAQIPLGGRRVELVADGDVATNPAVEAGAADFAEALETAGARVRVVLLPVAA